MQFETRLSKVTRSLAKNGFAEKIYLLGVWKQGLEKLETLDERREIRRFRLFTPRIAGSSLFRLLRLAEFSLRALLFSIRKKIDLVNCHMLVLLPVCVVMKKLLGTQLVYEPHEIETEEEWVSGRNKQILQRVEKALLPHADLIVHVGRDCAEWYENTYGIRPVHFLNNTPYAGTAEVIAPSKVLRDRFQLSSTDLLFIYQGLLLEERGIPKMLAAFAACPDKTRHVVFMGYGTYQEVVETFAQKHSNIHFLPAIPEPKLREYTAGADVGLCLPLPTSLNNRLCNPNKLYEYFLSGIPIIVSNMQGISRFVQENGCGWVVEPEEKALAALIAGITRENVSSVRRVIEKVRRNHGWEHEEKVLIRIYDNLWATKALNTQGVDREVANS